jgi:hypothetical protein
MNSVPSEAGEAVLGKGGSAAVAASEDNSAAAIKKSILLKDKKLGRFIQPPTYEWVGGEFAFG